MASERTLGQGVNEVRLFESEIEDLKKVCEKLKITPSELFSLNEGAFNHDTTAQRLRFLVARDLADFYKRRCAESRKRRETLIKRELDETNEEFQKYLKNKESKDQEKQKETTVRFSENNINSTSRRKGGLDDNSIRSQNSGQNSWVSNVTKSSYLGESILECEGDIEPGEEPSQYDDEDEDDWYSFVDRLPSLVDEDAPDSSYEFDQDYSFDYMEGSRFQPHPFLVSTPNRNEAGRKPMFRNTMVEQDRVTYSGAINDYDYDTAKFVRQGYCEEGFRSIMGTGSRLNDRFYRAQEEQDSMGSQMYEDDEEDDSCPFQSRFVPH